MMHFEVESDRDVLVSGIGLLPAGTPVEVSEVSAAIFEAVQGVKLVEANFPAYVKVTAVLPNDEGGE